MESTDIVEVLYQLQGFMLALWPLCPTWSATIRGELTALQPVSILLSSHLLNEFGLVK